MNNPITREEVEEVIRVILEEGRQKGYNEAYSIYNATIKKAAKNGRIGGFILGALTFGGAAVAIQYTQCKKIEKEKEEKEKAKKDDTPDWA